jgi:hypothetical protein
LNIREIIGVHVEDWQQVKIKMRKTIKEAILIV